MKSPLSNRWLGDPDPAEPPAGMPARGSRPAGEFTVTDITAASQLLADRMKEEARTSMDLYDLLKDQNPRPYFWEVYKPPSI